MKMGPPTWQLALAAGPDNNLANTTTSSFSAEKEPRNPTIVDMEMLSALF